MEKGKNPSIMMRLPPSTPEKNRGINPGVSAVPATWELNEEARGRMRPTSEEHLELVVVYRLSREKLCAGAYPKVLPCHS